MTRDELRSVLPGGKHHDVAMKWVSDDAAVLQWRLIDGEWHDCSPGFSGDVFASRAEIRVKPQTLRYRVALMKDAGDRHYLRIADEESDARGREQWKQFVRWVNDWQEVKA